MPIGLILVRFVICTKSAFPMTQCPLFDSDSDKAFVLVLHVREAMHTRRIIQLSDLNTAYCRSLKRRSLSSTNEHRVGRNLREKRIQGPMRPYDRGA